jgi:hypothetical protein
LINKISLLLEKCSRNFNQKFKYSANFSNRQKQ